MLEFLCMLLFSHLSPYLLKTRTIYRKETSSVTQYCLFLKSRDHWENCRVWYLCLIKEVHNLQFICRGLLVYWTLKSTRDLSYLQLVLETVKIWKFDENREWCFNTPFSHSYIRLFSLSMNISKLFCYEYNVLWIFYMNICL